MQILLDSWTHQRANNGFRLFGYVILENHLHFVVRAPRLNKCVGSFKSFTAARLIELPEAHKHDREYQFWQEGAHAEMIFSEAVMREKLDYIHRNPVKRGYVNIPEHWRYSSARNYLGEPGLIGIDPWS